MQAPIYILCYHRVLPKVTHETLAYFARGTAVTQKSFRQQLIQIRNNCELLSEDDVISVLNGEKFLERSGCWVTFDDGYLDVLRFAAPIIKELDIPASLFVTTKVLDGGVLPVDRWYAILASATKQKGRLEIIDPWEFDLNDHNSYLRFIDGPEKQLFINASADKQEEMLQILNDALNGKVAKTNKRIFLDQNEIVKLSRNNWSFGSHGVNHFILTKLTENQVDNELKWSKQILESLSGTEIKTFAYPDGQWNSYVVNPLKNNYYKAALCLSNRPVVADTDWYAIPRYIVTDQDLTFKQLENV